MIRKGPLNIINLGKNIIVIVITGGPCGGKTTALARLHSMLTERGYKVLISPESATKLIVAGMTPGELPWFEFQEEILLDTLAQEERILSIATKYRNLGRKVVVLCDRGAMDGEAYVGSETYGKLIQSLDLTHRELCDERYHAVIHLVTAANGAEEFYTLNNNGARIETPEEARALDERTRNAWTRHSHPRIIDNSTNFEGKLRRLFAEVCGILGDPIPLEKEQKFLIEPFDPSKITVDWCGSTIVQDYLVSPSVGEERRVRSRCSDGGTDPSFYYTIKGFVRPGVRTEEEKMIASNAYEALLQLRDPYKITLRKRRFCFFWKGQFFEADLFLNEREGLALLEAEQTEITPNLDLPPFLKIVRNVTEDKRFSNAEVAREDWVMPKFE